MCPWKFGVALHFLQFILEHKYNVKFGMLCCVWVNDCSQEEHMHQFRANPGSRGHGLWLLHAAAQTLRTLLFPVAAWALGQMHREVGSECGDVGSCDLSPCLIPFKTRSLICERGSVITYVPAHVIPYHSGALRFKTPAGYQC